VPAIDTPEALRQYAESIDSARTTAAASPPAATDSAPQLADATAAGSASASCLTSDQVVLGSVVSLGRSAIAVHDTATGVLQTIDAADCQVLVESPTP
jgi:hypothetical protein